MNEMVVNDEDFPFALVYDYIARKVIAACPADLAAEPRTMRPELLSVIVQDGAVVGVVPFPIHQFFASERGMDMVGALLQAIVPQIPDSTCLVLLSEAWVKSAAREPGQPLPERCPGNLAEDPDARECVLINLYRPHATRTGRLLFDAQRRPAYSPLLEDMVTLGGRFVPETGPAPGTATH